MVPWERRSPKPSLSAIFLSKELYDTVKSTEEALQITLTCLLKYEAILNDYVKRNATITTADTDQISQDLDSENFDNMKAINDSIPELLGKIYNVRLSLFDSMLTGSDSF